MGPAALRGCRPSCTGAHLGDVPPAGGRPVDRLRLRPRRPRPGPAQHRRGLRRRGLRGVAGPGTGLRPHRAGPPVGGRRRLAGPARRLRRGPRAGVGRSRSPAIARSHGPGRSHRGVGPDGPALRPTRHPRRARLRRARRRLPGPHPGQHRLAQPAHPPGGDPMPRTRRARTNQHRAPRTGPGRPAGCRDPDRRVRTQREWPGGSGHRHHPRAVVRRPRLGAATGRGEPGQLLRSRRRPGPPSPGRRADHRTGRGTGVPQWAMAAVPRLTHADRHPVPLHRRRADHRDRHPRAPEHADRRDRPHHHGFGRRRRRDNRGLTGQLAHS